MAFFVQGPWLIVAGDSYRMDWWSWPDGGNKGTQLFFATPRTPDAKLVISEFNKVIGTDGRYNYGFRVTNEGPQDVWYDVEGGGVV